MAYATPEQLAEALEIRVTPDNQQLLADCLDAAAAEIDHCLADADPNLDPFTDPIVIRVNVNRGVEWFKAPATYNGGIGTADIGVMTAPTSGFGRYWAALVPLRVGSPSGLA